MIQSIKTRLRLLEKLADRLAARREDLVVAAAQDIGAPCTITRMEVDLAVEHLRTMDL
jgi:acyl-CoA reductase-like NAD-dependent aldehyde dehydrogenase